MLLAFSVFLQLCIAHFVNWRLMAVVVVLLVNSLWWKSDARHKNDRIRNSMKFYNVLVHNVFSRSQHNSEHVTAVTLPWHVQNLVVMSWAHFKAQHCEFLSNLEFDWKYHWWDGHQIRVGYILFNICLGHIHKIKPYQKQIIKNMAAPVMNISIIIY